MFSGSMEPVLRRGDLVLYCNTDFSVGDVVIYCRTPSHCVVHRVVGFGEEKRNVVITKGDANQVPDPPIDRSAVRGRLVAVVPREVWVPLVALLTSLSIYNMIRSGAVGYSYTTTISVALAYVMAVYALVPMPLSPEGVRFPVLRLSGVYFESADCSLRVRYHGELRVTGALVYVNGTPADVVGLESKEIRVRPRKDLLGKAFESGKHLTVSVVARLNEVGTLVGNYTVPIGGVDPEVRSEGGLLLIRNPNCFPVSVVVSIRCGSGDSWSWIDVTYVVRGFSSIAIEPPEGCRYAYSYVRWLNQGDVRWVGVPLRTW